MGDVARQRRRAGEVGGAGGGAGAGGEGRARKGEPSRAVAVVGAP